MKEATNLDPSTFSITASASNGSSLSDVNVTPVFTMTTANSAVDELPSEHQPQESLPKRNPSPPPPDVEMRTNAAQVRWEAVLLPEGKLTDDGRMFAPGATTWRDLPLSLMVMTETADGHNGAWLAGRIDRIWRDGSDIRASGVFTEDALGQRAAKLVADGALSGVSVDTAVREYEVVSRDDLFDDDGNLIWPQPEQAATATEDEPNLLDILFGGDEENPVLVVTDGVIGAVTVCPFPAFADATISLNASGLIWTTESQAGFRMIRLPITVSEEDAGDGTPVLTAAAAGLAPLHPPMEWFENPELEELTPLTVDDDGYVFGHAAGWGTCHIGIPDACTVAPHSTTEYSLFHLGAVRSDAGDDIPIGKITLGTGHAPKHLGWQEAAAHYDNTGTVVADVTVGEDEYGIWVAGALRPDVPAERVRELRAAVLSGDWRDFNGNLELVALLAVNVPGFPIPRKRALMAAGEERTQVLTLVAAGITTGLPATEEELTEQHMARLQQLARSAHGELQANMECADCGHQEMAHQDGVGACSVDGCMCQQFAGSEGAFRERLAQLAEVAHRPFVPSSASVETFYSDDQPRDERGRWSPGGGGGGGAHEGHIVYPNPMYPGIHVAGDYQPDTSNGGKLSDSPGYSPSNYGNYSGSDGYGLEPTTGDRVESMHGEFQGVGEVTSTQTLDHGNAGKELRAYVSVDGEKVGPSAGLPGQSFSPSNLRLVGKNG